MNSGFKSVLMRQLQSAEPNAEETVINNVFVRQSFIFQTLLILFSLRKLRYVIP